MENKRLNSIDLGAIKTPAYILDERTLRKNGEILKSISEKSGAKFLLALKAFSSYCTFPILKDYLYGTTASSLNEYKLSVEEFGKETHIYNAAYRPDEFDSYLEHSSHITFNSFSQWKLFRDNVKKSAHRPNCGIRINPEISHVNTSLYNPCAPYSRFGVTKKEFEADELEGIEGFHFHTLCGSQAESLEKTLAAVEEKFGEYLHRVKWVNMGGGHYITAPTYNVPLLIDLIKKFKEKYDVEVYLEPGEAVVLHAGYLVASVLDIVKNEKEIAILDTSATAHMPDILEMPYQPNIHNASKSPTELAHSYLLGGATCLSGDTIGEYSFSEPLTVNSKLLFKDMAQYTIVKNTMFNGINLPSISILREDGTLDLIKSFDYQSFKSRV
jgi:carboxynorspermidine decarboxylase